MTSLPSLRAGPAHDLADALVASSMTPLLLLDSELHVVAASDSFCSLFRFEPAAGSALAELGAGEWNAPQLASLLKVTASGFAALEGYEMDLARDGRVTRRLVLHARKLQFAQGQETGLALWISDVTEARIAEKLKKDLLLEKDMLLKEIHHRVANSLQIIASVLTQSARKVQSEETRAHLSDAHQRIMSVAALQKQLVVSRMGEVEMRAYLTALGDCINTSLIGDRDQLSLTVSADESTASADASVSVGLIVTELVINALKHAFPAGRSGRIWIDYHSRGPNWTLSVRDDGVGMPQGAPGTGGLGTSIVQALARQLGAQVKISAGSPGTTVAIVHAYVPALVGIAGTAERTG